MKFPNWFRRSKQVNTNEKWLASTLESGSARGKAPPFSTRSSVAEYQSWVYAAANLNAQAVAAIPLRLYVRSEAQGAEKLFRTKRVPSGRAQYLQGAAQQKPSSRVQKAAISGDFEEVIDDHPILRLLRTANPQEDGFGMSLLRILYLELTGNAYLHVVTDPTLGVPAELWTMPAQFVTIKPGESSLVAAYLYGQRQSSMLEFAPDEVIHFKRPNPRSLYYGLGKVEAAWGAIQLNAATHEEDLALVQNMSRPDFAAIIKGGASVEAMRRFEDTMRQLHQGPKRSGRMIAISGDIQLQPLAFPTRDTSNRDEIVEEIAAVFGVPVSMLKANDPNLASATAGYAAWRESTIAPICRLDEETLNARLLPLFGIEDDAYLAYDNPVPANRQADSSERAVAVAGGWRTPNEARLEEGYDALETPEANALRGLPQPMPAAPNYSAVPNSSPPAPSVTVIPAKAIESPSADESSVSAPAISRAIERFAQLEGEAFAKAMKPDPRLDLIEGEMTRLRAKVRAADQLIDAIEATHDSD